MSLYGGRKCECELSKQYPHYSYLCTEVTLQIVKEEDPLKEDQNAIH